VPLNWLATNGSGVNRILLRDGARAKTVRDWVRRGVPSVLEMGLCRAHCPREKVDVFL